MISYIFFIITYRSYIGRVLAQANGIGPCWIGLCLIPGALASAWLGRKGGRLADKKGHAAFFYVASALLFAITIRMKGFAAR